MLKYEDFTNYQISKIANGCGSKGFGMAVPDFVFEESCNRHDIGYWIGGSEVDRKAIDVRYYYDMKNDARKASWFKRPFYFMTAWIYYKFVRMFGKPFFNFGPKKTRDDLLKLTEK